MTKEGDLKVYLSMVQSMWYRIHTMTELEEVIHYVVQLTWRCFDYKSDSYNHSYLSSKKGLFYSDLKNYFNCGIK